MSIDISGLDCKVQSSFIQIHVPQSHKLIQLANNLPIEELAYAVIEDLKLTTAKGYWWTGRRIVVRIHLMIYFLQKIFGYTDRTVVAKLSENAVYQAFCGMGLVEKWHIPAAQKVEEFRNRLSPETQLMIANLCCKMAVDLGFADPSIVDIDSTTQEANMGYPNDASLMVKLARKVDKLTNWIASRTRILSENPINIKEVLSKAKGYFFQSKNTPVEQKRTAFGKLLAETKAITYKGLEIFEKLNTEQIKKMPWNIKRDFEQVKKHAKRYILDVTHFARNHTLKAGKIMSFHLSEVACLTKGKAGKNHEFGREFQIARIAGNFVFSVLPENVRANDKTALPTIIDTHQNLFDTNIDSLAADKGYQSNINETSIAKSIDDYHLGYQYEDQSDEDYRRLYNRRSNIEATISHVKSGGQLGKSRMKSDQATLAAGYGAMAGFNLRQVMRKI